MFKITVSTNMKFKDVIDFFHPLQKETIKMFSFSSVKTLKLLRRILKSMAAAVAAMEPGLIAMAEMFHYR